MPLRRSRFRRALSTFMLIFCTASAIALLIVWFVSQGCSWERVIATKPGGWPWSFASYVMDPTSPANAGICYHWYRSRESGWRVGAFHGSVIIGRNRSLPRPARREWHSLWFGIQIAHGSVFGPYYYSNSTHFCTSCEFLKPEGYFADQAGAAALFNPVNTTIIFPAWLPLPLLVAYPIFWLLTGPVRRWVRQEKGLCIHCAYDLTGNTTGVCPECGTLC